MGMSFLIVGDEFMPEKKQTAADMVRSLPDTVWFCIAMGYLIFLVVVMTPHLKEMPEDINVYVLLMLAIPWGWFIWVRLVGGDEDE
jgi:hypothetical protein